MQKRRISIAAALAAALAFSMAPVPALAVEQQSAEVPVVRQATARQLSIAFPTSLNFAADSPLVVQEADSWGPLHATVQVQNGSDVDIYVSAAQIEQNATGARLGNLFASGTAVFTVSANGTSATSQINTVSGAGAAFTMPSNAKEVFAIAKEGGATSFQLDLDATACTPRPEADLQTLAGDTPVALGSISWTFATKDPEAELLAKDGFFLKISETATHADLAPNKGQLYSLSEVVAMADDLALNGTSSQYYSMFNAMLTSVDPIQNLDTVSYAAGQYTCRVRWKKAAADAGTPDGSMVFPGDTEAAEYYDYDVRVIGINHDILTTAADGRTTAGLTFQFVHVLNGCYWMQEDNYKTDGWGATTLRADMNPGKQVPVYYFDYDRIWETIPASLQNTFKFVSKKYNSVATATDLSGIKQASDKVFILSVSELCGNDSDTNQDINQPWINAEGEQYLYWKSKGIDYSYKNQVVFFSQLITGRQSSPTSGLYVWYRSINNNIPSGFLTFYSHNVAAHGANGPMFTELGVRPCFCL